MNAWGLPPISWAWYSNAMLTQHSQSLVLGFTLTVRFADSLRGYKTWVETNGW